MFMLGQEAPPTEEEEKIDAKAQALRNIAEFRDELFAGNQGKAMKVIGGTLIGLYVIYRFLLK